MEKLKVRVTLIIVFILLTIITAFTLFYNMYIQQFFSDINHDIFIHQIESYSDQINIKIEEERKELQRKVNDYLNQNKTTEEIMSVDELKNNYQIIIYQEENILPSVKNNFLLESYFIGYEKNIFTNYSSNESIIIYPIETNDETILFIHPVFEFIEEITKQNSYNGSYFIVTSEMDTVYQKEYSSLGFDEYIGKPRYSFTQNEEHYEKDKNIFIPINGGLHICSYLHFSRGGRY